MKKRQISQIKMGSLISYASIVIGIITGFLYTPWMVKQIGQSNYGLYTLATSLISFFVMDFGLGAAVTRFVSKYHAEGDQTAVNDVVNAVFRLYLIIDLLIVLVLVAVFFFLGDIYDSLTGPEMEQFKSLYIMVAVFNVVVFPFTPAAGILTAYEKFVQLKLCDIVHKLFTVVLVIVALNISTGVIWVVAANIISGLVAVIARLIMLTRYTKVKINLHTKTEKELYNQLFSFTLWTTIISIMQRFGYNIAPSILGITAGSVEIAVFSPAVTLEGYFFMVGAAVGGMFLPRVSQFIAQKQEQRVLDLMIKIGRFQVLVLGLIYIGFVCIGKDFMVLWMGPEYTKSYYCAILVLFPLIISSSLEIGNTTLIAKGILNYQAIAMIFSTSAGLIMSYVLSTYYGAIGVCVGLTLAALARAIFMAFICQKKGGISILRFIKETYLRAVPLYAASAVVSLLLIRVITLDGWIGLAVKAVVITAVFVFAAFLLYLSAEERRKILSLRRKTHGTTVN